MEKCPKCGDTGWYSYDENHHAKCALCCPHDEGWWELTEDFAGYVEGLDNRCCRAGCGTMARDITDQPSSEPSP